MSFFLDTALQVFGFILTIITYQLFLYLLNTKFEAKYTSKAIAPLTILVMLASLIAMSVANVQLNIALLLVYGLLLFGYTLLFRKGPVSHKLFWVVITLAFYAIGIMTSSVFGLIAFGPMDSQTPPPAWAMLQMNTITVLIQAAATFLLTHATNKTVKMSPLVMVLLVAIPVMSSFVLALLAQFGNRFGADDSLVALIIIISFCVAALNFATFIFYERMISLTEKNIAQEKYLQKAELEKVYHAEINNLYQETRVWRHDFRNHLQTIKSFCTKRNYEALDDYLDSLDKSVATMEFRINSGNEVLDAIVNPKIVEAEKQGICFQSDINVVSKDAIDPVDLTTLIGNLLDNAIEASEKIIQSDSTTKAIIEFEMTSTKGGHLIILVKNPLINQLEKQGDRFVSSKTKGDHGLGMQQIDSVVEKYDGFIMRETDSGTFSTLIRLPIESIISASSASL